MALSSRITGFQRKLVFQVLGFAGSCTYLFNMFEGLGTKTLWELGVSGRQMRRMREPWRVVT